MYWISYRNSGHFAWYVTCRPNAMDDSTRCQSYLKKDQIKQCADTQCEGQRLSLMCDIKTTIEKMRYVRTKWRKYWSIFVAGLCVYMCIFIVMYINQIGQCDRLASFPDEQFYEAELNQGTFAKHQQRKKLIIIGYMRSGSSLTGEIFNQHENVLYFFEPLHELEMKSNTFNRTMYFLDGTSR